MTGVQKLGDSRHALLYLPNGARHSHSLQLLLLTNRKSHTGFSFITRLMTLNHLERPVTTLSRYKHNGSTHLYSRSPLQLYSLKAGPASAGLCSWFVIT